MAAPKAVIPMLVGFMLLTGVCNTLLTKYQDMQCVADCDTDHPKTFEQPVIQTLQMFVGESGCWLVVFLSFLLRRFRKGSKTGLNGDVAYHPVNNRESEEDTQSDGDDDETMEHLSSSQTLVDPTNVVTKPLEDGEAVTKERRPLTGWKVAILALPAICDICGTTLMNAGLLFTAASIYQMTRGALVLFVGLFSVIFLKRHLGFWKWASLFIVVLGVAVVGLAGYLDKKHGPLKVPGDTVPGEPHDVLVAHTIRIIRDTVYIQEAPNAAQTVIGVLMIAGAQIFTASQFVLEESIMEKYSMDPIRVVGWEGIFGFSVTLIGMGVLHGAIGHGYFNARQAFYEVFHYRAVAVSSILIMVSIGCFNFFGLSVTRVISATSRSTIDTCRTLFIWIVSLGLGWETFKWLQIVGFVLLVWGTSLFNEIVNPPTLAFMRRRKRRWTEVPGEER
ncbi:hypothetical protein LTR37_008730 [Vermiconidia calcicola]|uniref:Uncharacterized protein n=1 Tax=Vermiconidia calcicola TaxID=1690605 RepID=A0ACC3N9R5_9PEZI|nr:hypothetical protein LTR37_008730 [Vermiconidia calcicola]